MSEVRVGVIGCGGIAHAAHFPHYMSIDGVRVTAVADVDEDAAKKAAEQYGADAFYTNYKELVASDDVDAVSVTTPPKWHAAPAVAAARAGKHVLVEKPMCRNVDEADAMVNAAKQAGVILMATHQTRLSPLNIKVKELLEAGVIGKPHEISGLGGSWHMVGSPWFYDKDTAGGGVGMDGMIYTAHIWQYWMGQVSSVYALTDTFVKQHPVYVWNSDDEDDVEITSTPDVTVEDQLAMLIRFENGAVGMMHNSWVSPVPHGYAEIVGSDGVIMPEGKDGGGPQVFVKEDTGEFKKGWNPLSAEDGNVYFDRIQHFIDCIRDGVEPITTGEEGSAAVELIQAAYVSSQERRPVELPLPRSTSNA